MQDDVVALFAYDRWANRKVLDACRKLTAEQYVAEPVPGWSSVRSTVYHIALVTEIHLRKLAGDPDDRSRLKPTWPPWTTRPGCWSAPIDASRSFSRR